MSQKAYNFTDHSHPDLSDIDSDWPKECRAKRDKVIERPAYNSLHLNLKEICGDFYPITHESYFLKKLQKNPVLHVTIMQIVETEKLICTSSSVDTQPKPVEISFWPIQHSQHVFSFL